jgi:hypothetical protein
MNDGGFFNYDNLNNIIRNSSRQHNSRNRNEKINNLLISNDENKNNANFTKEFYKERYNIPSHIPTPSNFRTTEIENRGEYALSLIK